MMLSPPTLNAAPADAQAQAPLTPQQRLAQALMAAAQPATADQGQYSPLQGIAQLGNQTLALRMLRQQAGQAQPAQSAPFSLGATQ